MAKRAQYEFELYRLNIADSDRSLFDQDRPTLSGNDDAILTVLKAATSPDFSYETETTRTSYRWDVRDFTDYAESSTTEQRVVSITLARSLVVEKGDIVTDEGIVAGTSEAIPPRADHIDLHFHMSRHLVAVERYTPVTGTGRWRLALHDILEQASLREGYRGRIELEPVPREEEIMAAFRSFERLTRLRVWLRIPNPELSRYAQTLYREMEEGGIREYLTDMRSTKGLNKDEGKLPHSAAEIAQSGYKKGTVKLEGIRNGRKDKAETGGKAARGHITQLREFARGMKANAKAKETQQCLNALLTEMDRIAPRPDDGEIEQKPDEKKTDAEQQT